MCGGEVGNSWREVVDALETFLGALHALIVHYLMISSIPGLCQFPRPGSMYTRLRHVKQKSWQRLIYQVYIGE